MKKMITCLPAVSVLSCLSVSGQSLVPEIHRNDSVMWKLEYKYGKKKPWRNIGYADTLSSVIVRKPGTSMMIAPGASRFTMNTKYYPKSVFSRKDDIMWAKDYGWGNFVSDFLFGM